MVGQDTTLGAPPASLPASFGVATQLTSGALSPWGPTLVPFSWISSDCGTQGLCQGSGLIAPLLLLS